MLFATGELPANEPFMLKKTLLIFSFFFFLTFFCGSYDRLDATTRVVSPVMATDFEDHSLLAEGAYAISTYDNLFRSISEREGNDWRLMSAIAYHESRFMPALQSKRGARGIMQIMPSVARQFHVDPDKLGDLKTNIWLANRLLNELSDMMSIPKGTPEVDRLSLILAAYNGGIGHVSDARRLARAHGANPHSWSDVSHYLKLKSDPAYYQHEVVRNGRFTGYGQTAAYVENVLNRYARYCRQVERN